MSIIKSQVWRIAFFVVVFSVQCICSLKGQVGDRLSFGEKIVSYYANFVSCRVDTEESFRGNITDVSLVCTREALRVTKTSRREGIAPMEILYLEDEIYATKENREDQTVIIVRPNFARGDVVRAKGGQSSGIVLGYVADIWIPDIINRPEIEFREENSNEQSLFVFEGAFIDEEGKKIDIKLFFNPVFEGAVSKVEASIVYTPDSLGDWFSREGVSPQDYPLLMETDVIENSQFKELSTGIWVPQNVKHVITPCPMFTQSKERDSANLKLKILRDNTGKPVLRKLPIQTREISIKNIVLSPQIAQNKLSWSEETPNGTKVVRMDAQQIRYVWLDGKVVPWTDEVMYAIATEGHEFKPGYSEPRFWMITISIVLFALAFAKLIYDYCKNKK